MAAPFFSVVIPTRERAGTLLYALKSCATQSYQDAEFIVSNNASTDNTEEIVRDFNDARIRLINTERRVSMRENWEFALEHVQGRYVIFIGDDDALMPGALETLAKLLTIAPVDAVKWNAPTYYWPQMNHPLTGKIVYEPQRQSAYVNSTAALTAVRWGYLYYHYLPMVYHGLVSMACIKKIREKSGEFFLSEIPDIYSGIVVASATDRYIYLQSPQTISGASQYSNGTSFFKSPFAKSGTPAGIFHSENKLKAHRHFVNLADIPSSIHACVTDAFLRARDALKCRNLSVPIWYRLFMIMRELAQRSEIDMAARDSALKLYSQGLGLGWLYNFYLCGLRRGNSAANAKPTSSSNAIDLKKFGVSDVYGAAVFLANLLNQEPVAKPELHVTTLSLLFGRIEKKLNRSRASKFFVPMT